jgi:hypothetical protein
MMRLLRASAIVALSLLSLPATAYAECDAVAGGGSESSAAVAECWTGRLIQVGRSAWQSLLST